ncbi:hypothetical protein XANCAGTX0491_000443 [Xanthoria calcicola]
MAESTSHQASTAARPPLKRTLFSKPSWVQQDNSTSSTDFFRRSNQSYLAIAAEAERKRQRKQARKRQEQSHQHKDARRTHKQPRTPSDSDSADDSDHSKIDDGRCSQPDKEQMIPLAPITQLPELKRLPTAAEPESSLMSLSKRYESVTSTKAANGKLTLQPSNVIDLEDSDDSQNGHQDHVNRVATIKHSPPVEDDDDLPPSDDEYAELVLKAREKARRKRLEDDIPCPAIQKDRLSSVGSMNKPNPPPATADPAVSILITSRIPNTNPLIVNRKVSQRLKDVRLAWCHRQQFGPATTEAVFLTWKGKRLFDVTTCRSLGIGVDSQGNIMTKGRRDILGDEEDQIHMEAMTEGILQGDQRAKRQDTENAEHEMEAHEQALAVKRKEPQVRIILKAKGFDDFKLIVKPTTPIYRIVNAFKMDKQIEDSREVFLSFDGDRLAPEIQVTNTELSDMDYIDVYVK